MKKTFYLLPFVALGSLILPACGSGSTDSSKTQLYVGFYDAGLGRDWIKKSIANFESAYANYSFESGKTGVQVLVDYDKAGLGGANLLGTISGKKQTVFITENVEYYSYVSKGVLYNIDNVVKNKDDVYTDSLTIEEKLDQDAKDYYTMIDGHYYALPYYEGLMGFEYDIDLFDKNLLYFKMQKDKEPVKENALSELFDPSDYFVSSLTEERSYGPDGKTGVIEGIDYSLDDGLPSTFNEFYALEKQMVSLEVTPFVWCTNYVGYLIDEMVALVADIEGKEQWNLNYNWNGTATDLVESIDANGNVTLAPSTSITVDNANLLQKQLGRYKALEFAKNIVSSSDYYVEDMGFTHTQAQKAFINTGSWFDDIGMLIDGSWWENEGSSYFSTTKESESRLGRKFGMMPFPKMDVETWKEQKGTTYFSENQSMMFMNANTDSSHLEVSEKFIRFLHKDSELQQFTQTTSMMRPYNYTMSKEQLANTSYYGNQMYNIRQRVLSSSCKDELVYYYPLNITVAKNETTVSKNTWYFSSSDGYTNPISIFSTKPEVTAKGYFEGLYKKYSSWNPNK